MKQSFKILFALLIIQFGCMREPECGFDSEPVVTIVFNSKSSILEFDSVFGIENGVRKEILNENYNLPLNLNSDSVTYVFMRNNVKDTVSLYYKLNFNFDLECKWQVDVSNMTCKTSFSPNTIIDINEYYPEIVLYVQL